MTERVVVMGAAGRDFHDYFVELRDDPEREVVAFTRAPGQNLGETAAEGFADFPAELTPEGTGSIPIVPEPIWRRRSPSATPTSCCSPTRTSRTRT
ncbi:hypothetical protein MBEHAL_0530 [Halarchaeum acidiphilum MH1-52-1]|uniref:GTPase n=1 Tax=Halarchaeum acidiphilum MH1-52-1 TaxID=1261545 RepID=U2YRZ9_9EURY|nr:hypothetical protein [Halarchaeum acidiphilum]GAD51770.1 hypothetical protein MBEHAL_0530 [Halarchaeum acidiphilum MH1-52-1]